MDAREIIEQAASDPGAFVAAKHINEPLTQWQARAIMAALARYDLCILHDSDNHGPTRDRAAGVADLCGNAAPKVSAAIARHIRAMEVKHG